MTEPTMTPRFRIYFEPLPVYRHEDPLVAAANAGPSWSVQFKPVADPGAAPRSYTLWHPMDLSWPQFFKLQSSEQELTGTALLTGVPDRIRLVMPELPEEVFNALTANQIVSIAAKSWQVPGDTAPEPAPANPPVGERALDTSSRSPHGSSGGPTGS